MSGPDSMLLCGLDGSNPLAFLAALGTLRTLTLALPDEVVRMSWEEHDGTWRPRVWASVAHDRDTLLSTLDVKLKEAAERRAFTIADSLTLKPTEFRAVCVSLELDPAAMADPHARIDADFLAAFGSDCMATPDGRMQDTAFRTMSGAGHQHFLKFFRELIAKTETGHIERALLSVWDYGDEGRGLNLRWDPVDDRRYALRWGNPSEDPIKTMRGANRLAIEALPLFATCPTTAGLATTGFPNDVQQGRAFVWPIWIHAIGVDALRGLLGRVGGLAGHAHVRTSIGIAAMYASTRITTGKFRNFTPSRPV